MLLIFITLLTTGCGIFQAQKKPELGPTGSGEEAKANPPFWERFDKPPSQLYDLEELSGTLFESISHRNWDGALEQTTALRKTWEESKSQIGDKKGVKEADEALQKVSAAISNNNTLDSYETLNQFLAAVSDIGKSYKLSALSDILLIGNSVRNVGYYVAEKDWTKANTKVNELEGTWLQVKPSMEQLGILSEVTKAHGTIKSLKDSVTSENQGAAENQLKLLNESLGNIRDFYKNK
jgi:hypothetical protein